MPHLDASRVRQVAAGLLPGETTATAEVVTGEFHDVLLLPGRAVVKVARGRSAGHLRRRARLAGALAHQDLPFTVPAPLTDVTTHEDCAAVALAWAPGRPAQPGSGDPRRLRGLLEALASVDVTASGPVAPWLDVPHAYAGRERWAELMDEVADRLPGHVRAEARARTQAALDLPAPDPSLVHGDLAGHNLRWHDDGRLAAVIDWDVASAWDPAVDAACLAWFGWDAVAAAVAPETLERARTWAATFPLEHPASAIDNGEDDDVVSDRLAHTASRLLSQRSGLSRLSRRW